MPREISGGKKVVPRTRFLERGTAEFSAGRCPTDILSVCLEGEGTKWNLEAEQFDIIDVITLTFVGYHIDPAWNG